MKNAIPPQERPYFISNFKEMKVWQKAHELALQVYKVTDSFPAQEVQGLSQQMRCTAVTITSRIAEGVARTENAEIRRYLEIAASNTFAMESQLQLACDLNYIPKNQRALFMSEVDKVKRMLATLMTVVKSE